MPRAEPPGPDRDRTVIRNTSLLKALAMRTVTGALVVQEDTTVEFVTDSALAQFGVSREEIIGASLLDFGDLVDNGNEVAWTAVLDAHSPMTSLRVHTRPPRGERRWLEASIERVSTESQDGVVLIVHDVTPRVTAEVRRERDVRYENHLARYNVMGDMAMAIAHELAQPLSAASNYLSGIAELPLTEGPAADSARFGLANARRQIERASRIVTSLRGFVGNLEQVEQIADLNAIVEECLDFVRIRAREAEVRLDVALHPRPLPTRCERVLTGQVVLNLCFNAVDEMRQTPPEQRIVRVRTRDDGELTTFSVEDRGRGATRLSYDQMFESAATTKSEGSGIGLGLSYRIITRQHGTIGATAAQPTGSVFWFSLPAGHASRRP